MQMHGGNQPKARIVLCGHSCVLSKAAGPSEVRLLTRLVAPGWAARSRLTPSSQSQRSTPRLRRSRGRGSSDGQPGGGRSSRQRGDKKQAFDVQRTER